MRTAVLIVALGCAGAVDVTHAAPSLAARTYAVPGEGTLAGTWEGKEGTSTLRMTLRREGESDTYTGEVGDGEDTARLSLSVNGTKVEGRATMGERSFDLVGEWSGDTLTLREKDDGDDEIVFTRVGAKAATPAAEAKAEGELLGVWRGEIDGSVQNLIIRQTGDLLIGTVIVDGEPATLRGTRAGDTWKGVAEIEGGKEKVEFVGTFKGDTLTLVGEGEALTFTKLGPEEAKGALGIMLETGIFVTPPSGWRVKREGGMWWLEAPDAAARVMLWDQALKGRTHEEFAKAFTGVLAELRWELPEGGWQTIEGESRSKARVRFRPTKADDGAGAEGFAGVLTKGEAGLGALLIGSGPDVDKVMRDAEKMMKELRWPGEAKHAEKDRNDNPPKHTAPAPAPQPPPNSERASLPGVLDFAYPQAWHIEKNDDDVTLEPNDARDGDDEVYVVSSRPLLGASEAQAPAVRAALMEDFRASNEKVTVVGEPRVILSGAQRGAVYTFDSETGERTMAYALVHGGRPFTLRALGPKEALERHAREAELIFRSFTPKGGTGK